MCNESIVHAYWIFEYRTAHGIQNEPNPPHSAKYINANVHFLSHSVFGPQVCRPSPNTICPEIRRIDRPPVDVVAAVVAVVVRCRF